MTESNLLPKSVASRWAGARGLVYAAVCMMLLFTASAPAAQWSKTFLLQTDRPRLGIDFNGDNLDEVIVATPMGCDVYSGATGASLWHLPFTSPGVGSWDTVLPCSAAENGSNGVTRLRDLNADGIRELTFFRNIGTGVTARTVIQVYNTNKLLKWQTPVYNGFCGNFSIGQADTDSAKELAYIVDDKRTVPTCSTLRLVDGRTGAVQFTKLFPEGASLIDMVDFNNDGLDEVLYMVNNLTLYACNGAGTVLWTLTPTHPHPGSLSSVVNLTKTWLSYTARQVPPDLDSNGHRDLLLTFWDTSVDPVTHLPKTRSVLRLYDTVNKTAVWQGPDMWMAVSPGQPFLVPYTTVDNVDGIPGLEIVSRYRNTSGSPVLQVFSGKQASYTAVPRFNKIFAGSAVLSVPQVMDINNDGANDVIMCVNNAVNAYSGLNGTLLWTLPVAAPNANLKPAGIWNIKCATRAGALTLGSRLVPSDVNANGTSDLVVPLTTTAAEITTPGITCQTAVQLYAIPTKTLQWQKVFNNLRTGDLVGGIARPADADPQDEIFIYGLKTPANVNTMLTVLDGSVP